MPASMPTVSVIIPTYNRLEALQLAIDSVKAQTSPALEIIVIDDGSTDGTVYWCQQHHPDITLITQTNHGVSHARNRGIEIANGDWIALLDSDDRWYPKKLEIQLEAIVSSPKLRLCHCDEIWIRNGKRVNQKHKHRKYGGNIFKYCLPLCAISPSASLIHASVFNDIGLFDENLPACEDYDLWLRITSQEDVLYVDEALLEKTGGHEDQLSQRYPAMDSFRLTALAKLLRSASLSTEQYDITLNTFREKLTIYCNGARKRGRTESIKGMLKSYQDLAKSDFNV